MRKIRHVRPKFRVKNVSEQAVSILGGTTIQPGITKDLFEAIKGLSEATIVDALREPDGSLFKELKSTKRLELLEYELVSFSNAYSIVSNTDPAPGMVLEPDGLGLSWHEKPAIPSSNTINVNFPLTKSSDTIYLPKANKQTSGYLSKEDWSIFSGVRDNIKVWQYQDFYKFQDGVLKITHFENGDAPFSEAYIVNGSAVIAERDTEKPIYNGNFLDKALKLSKNKIKVQTHIGNTVVLSAKPDKPIDVRLYFIAAIPLQYVNIETYNKVPKYIRDERIELISNYDIDNSSNKEILGSKYFQNEVLFSKRVGIATKYPMADLDVAGTIKTQKLFVDDSNIGYVLTANESDQAIWATSPINGTVPPTSPYPGQMWLRLTDMEVFIYDGIRKAWLSQTTYTVSGSNDSINTSNSYMNHPGGVSMVSTSAILPFNAILSYITASSNNDSNWKLEVHSGNQYVSEAEIFCNARNNYRNNLNVLFEAGSRVELFVNGNNVSMPVSAVFFRKTL